MIDLRKLEAAAERLGALLPDDAHLLREEVKSNLRPLLESMLQRMELVTREEFDAQSRVLEHTRAKLERLERRVAELEQERAAT